MLTKTLNESWDTQRSKNIQIIINLVKFRYTITDFDNAYINPNHLVKFTNKWVMCSQHWCLN